MGVRTANEEAGATIRHRTNRAGAPSLMGKPFELMPVALESIAQFWIGSAFDLQTTGKGIVRLEGVGETVGGKARRFRGDLGIHFEEDLV